MNPGSTAAGRDRLARVVRHPLTWVVVAAVAIRVVVVAGVSVSLTYSDTTRYVAQASGEDVEGSGIAPPGYALFLRLVHALTSSVDAVLIVQQLLGIVAGLCVYAATRQMGTTRGVAAGAAAVMMLCGNLLATGQAVLTESLFTTLMALVGLLAVRQAVTPSIRGGVLLGAAMGAALCVRTVALPIAVLLVLLILAIADRSRQGLLRAGASCAAVAVVVGIVALAMSTTSGMPVIGETAQGWVLYGRVAQFADCNDIDPPRKLRSLCVVDPGLRPGPDYYRFVDGPAVTRFGAPPRGDAQLNDFAVRAILAQPVDYAKTVAIDGARFFAPSFGSERPFNGPGWDELELDRVVDPASAATNQEAIETWFSAFSPRDSTLRLVARYQEITTIQGGQLLVLMLLAVAGAVWAQGSRRVPAWILLIGAVALLVFATATTQYVARYSLPAFGFVLPAAAYGLTMLARRIGPSSAGGATPAGS